MQWLNVTLLFFYNFALLICFLILDLSFPWLTKIVFALLGFESQVCLSKINIWQPIPISIYINEVVYYISLRFLCTLP